VENLTFVFARCSFVRRRVKKGAPMLIDQT
jgi:hypothetical protein